MKIFISVLSILLLVLATHVPTSQAASSASMALRSRAKTSKAVKVGRIVATKQNTEVKAKGMIGAIGDTVPLKAYLYVAGKKKGIAKRVLHYRVNGNPIGTALTNSKGLALFKFKVPNSMGKKTIQVIFKGGPHYKGSSGKSKFAPIRSSTALKTEETTAKPGAVAHLKGKLTRKTDGYGPVGREVLLDINGKVVARASTLKGGRFTIKYKIPKGTKGNIATKVWFKGDKLYIPSAKTAYITVLGPKRKIYLTWTGAQGMVGERATITASLSTSKLFPFKGNLANKKIRVWRSRGKRWYGPQYKNKQICKGRTDKKGVARMSFIIDDDAMSYSVGAHFDQARPHKYELIKRSDPKLTVIKSPLRISVSCGVKKAHIGDRLLFTVVVKRVSDGRALPKVQVSLGGQKKLTSTMGSAGFFHTIRNTGELGPRKIYAQTKETKRYKAGKGYALLNVLPAQN